MPVDFASLDTLRRTHPAWRLLAAEHAPLVISFLHATFVLPNVRSLPHEELVSKLDDHLFHLRERHGASSFPRSAAEYLETWAGDAHGWLRRYYAADRDEPWFDITPSTEKAIGFVVALEQRRFVGTESRLMTVFDLLQQIVEGTETDVDTRLADLEARRAAIDAEMARVREGDIAVMDDIQVKDRFQQIAGTARELLSDFREVEANFRTLDRDVRERIATWTAGKGALLEEIFGARDAIGDSDQGRSFRAFWDLLMSPDRQERLTTMLQRVLALEPVRELQPDRRLLRVHYDWLTAGEVAQRTVARLSEQLRRFLDDQAWQDNRRILGILREIEQHAIAVRGAGPDSHAPFMEVDDFGPGLLLPMERPLFAPPYHARITAGVVVEGEGNVSADALFDQFFVDKERLLTNVRWALQTRAQISLGELLETCPLEQGLAELVTYLCIAADDAHAVIDDRNPQTVTWRDADRGRRAARIPCVLFTRGATGHEQA